MPGADSFLGNEFQSVRIGTKLDQFSQIPGRIAETKYNCLNKGRRLSSNPSVFCASWRNNS
jgi:hypothetical protein